MDKPIYTDTHFRIESGYEWGHGMSKEKTEAFFAEIRSLFSHNGFTIEECKYGGCPEAVQDKTRLYCHPQELSGPVRKELIGRIEKILRQGTTFQYLRTDIYGELLDLTEEEELACYHKVHDRIIEEVFSEAFRTRARNLYKYREQVLEGIARKLRVSTLRERHGYTSFSPVWHYIREIYGKMVVKGELIEGYKQTGSGTLPLCRTATDKELKTNKQKGDGTKSEE